MIYLFDFDEVFVDLNTGALKYINEKLNTKYNEKDITSWDFFERPEIKPHFFNFLAIPDLYQSYAIPNKKMIKVLKQLVEMGKPVYIVTASLESSEKSKFQFITEHMKFFDTNNLFTVNGSSKYKNKSDVLAELNLDYHEPTILIDDGIHNILDMMADINHKDMLDGMMKQFYIKRTLSKFNNPYHEFIYGIVPELPYNKDINDGKRIFKLKEAKDIWVIFDKIKVQHKVRVENKQAEVFNYLSSIVNDLLPAENFKEANELQNNVSFLSKNILNNSNVHAGFLSDIARFCVKIENILEANTKELNKNGSEVKKMIIESIFKSADKKFGFDVMYNEIKNLVILHIAKNAMPEHAKLGFQVSEKYEINDKQLDLFSPSLIKTIIDISKENISAGRSIIKSIETNEDNKVILENLLHKAGMAYEIDFEDKIALTANTILAFNKNFGLDSNNSLIIKNQEIDDIRKQFINSKEKTNKPRL